jgi:hypothetical protein
VEEEKQSILVENKKEEDQKVAQLHSEIDSEH